MSGGNACLRIAVKRQKRLKRRNLFLFLFWFSCVSKLVASGASKLRVVALDGGLEKTFWAQVNQDPLDFHFFVYDWMFKRAQTQIFMALDGEMRLLGYWLFTGVVLYRCVGRVKRCDCCLKGLMLRVLHYRFLWTAQTLLRKNFLLLSRKPLLFFWVLRRARAINRLSRAYHRNFFTKNRVSGFYANPYLSLIS